MLVYRALCALTLAMAGGMLDAASAQILTAQPPPLAKWDAQAVQDIADQLQVVADRTRLTASQQTKPGRSRPASALADLTSLSAAIQRFTTQLRQFPQNADQTRPDYLAMLAAHVRAKESVVAAGYDSKVMQDFNLVGLLLDRLNPVYMQHWNRETAQSAARTLEDATKTAAGIATSQAVSDSPADERALFFLRRLAEAAVYLNQQLHLDPDPIGTAADFHTLADDYALAVGSLAAAGFNDRVRPELNMAGESIGRLRRAYQVTWNGSNARVLADAIHVAAQRLATSAAASAPDDVSRSRVLNDLSVLAGAADTLTRQLEVRPDSPLQTYADFMSLRAAYDQAGLSLARARVSESSGTSIKLGREVAQLNRLYWNALDQAPARLTGNITGR